MLQRLTQVENEGKTEQAFSFPSKRIARDRISNWIPLLPQGIACRDETGTIIVPDKPLVVENLDNLPFPYPDLEEVAAQHKIVYYEASRGCPFHCAYCLSGISHSVRRRSLDLVLADMDRFMQAGAALVKFVDRTYNLDENYYLPMLQYLAAADTKTLGDKLIEKELLTIPNELVRERCIQYLKEEVNGKRDFRF